MADADMLPWPMLSHAAVATAAQASLEVKGHERDLMHIRAASVRGLAVVCSGDAAGVAAAKRTIMAVDAASEGVVLIQARKVHADVAVEGFAMHLATCTQVGSCYLPAWGLAFHSCGEGWWLGAGDLLHCMFSLAAVQSRAGQTTFAGLLSALPA